MFGVQFYPTPYDLVEHMMDKVDWNKVHFALEPSAGKGNIVEGMKRRLKGKKAQVECVEIDPDLRNVLEGKGFCVVGTDFLAWDGVTRYDLIAMNPPFKDGDEHLAKALELMKHGGQIVCLLNASTVERNGENLRGELLDKLEEYGADIELLSGAFSGAERKTDVDVAMVYVNIPKAHEKELSFDELSEAVEVPGESGEVTDMVEADFFRALVRYYQMEARLGLKVIDQFEELERYIPEQEDHCQRHSMLSLVVSAKEYELKEAQRRVTERRELLMCQRCGGIPKKKEFKGANFLYFECECGNQTLCYESEYEAILSWNTRISVLSQEQIKHLEE